MVLEYVDRTKTLPLNRLCYIDNAQGANLVEVNASHSFVNEKYLC